MTTYLYAMAVTGAVDLSNFSVFDDVLLFETQAASAIRLVDLGDGSIQIGPPGAMVELPVPLRAITSGNNGIIRFLDGSRLLLGDNALDQTSDDSANLLTGDSEGDQLRGLGGDDTLNGGAGNDRIYGNADNDSLFGELGKDTAFGGQGDDDLHFGGSNQGVVIYGNLGIDSMQGSSFIDVMFAGQGDDFIDAGDGDDRIYGNAGADSIADGEGNDTIFAGQGNDTILSNGTSGSNLTYGNLGDDYILGGVDAAIIFGGQGNDTIQVESGADTIFANAGDDILQVLQVSGDAIFSGGAGNDKLELGLGGGLQADINCSGMEIIALQWTGGSGTQMLTVEADGPLLIDGSALISAQALSLTVNGSSDATLYGGASQDMLIGGDGNDVIYGLTSGDTLMGSAGDDLLIGGLNTDEIYGGDGRDTISLSTGDANGYQSFAHEIVHDFNADEDSFAIMGAATPASFVDRTATDYDFQPTLSIVVFQIKFATGTSVSANLFTYAGDTYLLISDGINPSILSQNDHLIELVGLSGTLSADNFLTPA